MRKQAEYDMNLKQAIRKAYKTSPRGELDAAIALVSKWRRKETIARNKLADAIDNLQRVAGEHVARIQEKEQAADATMEATPGA